MPKKPNMVMRIDDPRQKIGRHWRFHKAVIDKWLGQHASSAREAHKNAPGSDGFNNDRHAAAIG